MRSTILVNDDVAASVFWSALDREPYDDLVDRNTDPDDRLDEESFWAELLALTVDRVVVQGETIEPTSGEINTMLKEWAPDGIDQLIAEVLEASAPHSIEWARLRLKRNPRLAIEVTLCNRLGVSHSDFLAWAKVDQALAMAGLHESQDVCQGCGVPARDMDDPLAWTPVARECVHCEARDHLLEAIPDQARGRIHIVMMPGEAVLPSAS